MNQSKIKISIVIPVYNGEKTIESLFLEINHFFKDQGDKFNFEVIFVHDCGPDNSWKVIQLLKDAYPQNIIAIQLTRNFGQHNALICGFEYASGDYVVTMDEDLQHQPRDIAKLLDKQKLGEYDVVYGKYKTQSHPLFRNFTSNFVRRLLSWAIPELHSEYTAFRLIRASTAKHCISMQNSYTFLDGYLSWITTNVASTLVDHQERFAGQSSYTIKKLIVHTVNIFTTFSNLPIRFLTYTSIFIFSLSLVYSLVIIYKKIFLGNLLPGYASLIIVMGFGVGLILLGMGIIGEYIHRINQKTTKRPNFVKRKILI